MKPRWILLLAALTVVSAASAAPVVIFSNFGSPDHFNGSFGASVNRALAVSFVAPDPNVPGFVYGLQSVDFAGLISNVDSNPSTVSLFSDLGGLPGASLVSMSASLTENATEVNVVAPFHPALAPNTTYWIVLSNPFSFDVTWSAAGNGALGIASLGPETWGFLESYGQGAVRVNAVLVPAPEPGTLLMMFGGLAGAASRRLRALAGFLLTAALILCGSVLRS